MSVDTNQTPKKLTEIVEQAVRQFIFKMQSYVETSLNSAVERTVNAIKQRTLNFKQNDSTAPDTDQQQPANLFCCDFDLLSH